MQENNDDISLKEIPWEEADQPTKMGTPIDFITESFIIDEHVKEQSKHVMAAFRAIGERNALLGGGPPNWRPSTDKKDDPGVDG